jgi:hypothetical protein
MRGPLWATLIHTSSLTLQVQRTLSLFRQVPAVYSPVLPASPTGYPRHNYEVDVNGLNYDGAKKLGE